jgi:hypothetical protein
MSHKRSESNIINAGRDGEFLFDFLMKSQISIGWRVGDKSENRYGDFRKYSAEEIREDNPSGDSRQPVVKFLGQHQDRDKNLHIGDTVIVYAPKPIEIVGGVFTITSEPMYDRHPIQLNDDPHCYYREVVPKSWSKPVEYSEFEEHYDGTGIRRRPTLQTFQGNLSDVEEAIRQAPPADLSEYTDQYQLHVHE